MCCVGGCLRTHESQGPGGPYAEGAVGNGAHKSRWTLVLVGRGPTVRGQPGAGSAAGPAAGPAAGLQHSTTGPQHSTTGADCRSRLQDSSTGFANIVSTSLPPRQPKDSAHQQHSTPRHLDTSTPRHIDTSIRSRNDQEQDKTAPAGTPT